jgi:hypothetical protein
VTSLILRTVVAGAYLTALLLHGQYDLRVALVVCGIVLIWLAPLARARALSRHRPAVG